MTTTFANGQLVRHSSGRTLRVYSYPRPYQVVCADPHTGEQLREWFDPYHLSPLSDRELNEFVEGNWK